MEVQFKDVMIQPLPTPTPGHDTQPGFHLRTIKTEPGRAASTRSTSPRATTARRRSRSSCSSTAPASAVTTGSHRPQVGLGPAILNRPGGLPAIVVFPQARRTWAADSADSAVAVQALDDA